MKMAAAAPRLAMMTSLKSTQPLEETIHIRNTLCLSIAFVPLNEIVNDDSMSFEALRSLESLEALFADLFHFMVGFQVRNMVFGVGLSLATNFAFIQLVFNFGCFFFDVGLV